MAHPNGSDNEGTTEEESIIAGDSTGLGPMSTGEHIKSLSFPNLGLTFL